MHNLKRSLLMLFVLAFLIPTSVFAKSPPFPETIPLPDGFRPEGIVSGYGTQFYAGSLANGAIFMGDFRSGDGGILVEGTPGHIAVGLAFDERSGYLFVAGGTTGTATVYNAGNGDRLARYTLASAGSFINDVIVTPTAAFFTDSFNARLFKLPLSADGGLPGAAQVETLPLSGDWTQASGFNANGIEATPNGEALIVVNSGQGTLFKVNPENGEAQLIDLDGASVSAGDGLLLDGKTLYVVRNQRNEIAVVQLASDFTSGELTGTISNTAFDIPTTVTEFGNRLYAVNARFGTPPTPTTKYDVVQVFKP